MSAIRNCWNGVSVSLETFQMNVRMPAELKVQGDNRFEEVSQEIGSKMLSLGADFLSPNACDLSDAELLEMAYYDKAWERGVL